MSSREVIREQRVTELIDGFERFFQVFEMDPAFSRVGQLENHVRTIDLRRNHGSAASALADDHFLETLHATLGSLGIGKRASRLAGLPRFKSQLRNREGALAALDQARIDTSELSQLESVWAPITEIDTIDNEAQLVGMTKTLHHILPDLVVPIDRAYTGTFLRWHVPEFQHRQRDIFVSAWSAARRIGKSVALDQFVGRHPWNTSITKVIDNAIVGYCVSKQLDTGTVASLNRNLQNHRTVSSGIGAPSRAS